MPVGQQRLCRSAQCQELEYSTAAQLEALACHSTYGRVEGKAQALLSSTLIMMPPAGAATPGYNHVARRASTPLLFRGKSRAIKMRFSAEINITAHAPSRGGVHGVALHATATSSRALGPPPRAEPLYPTKPPSRLTKKTSPPT